MRRFFRIANVAKFSLLLVSAIFFTGCALGTTRLAVAHAPLAQVASKRQGDILVRPFVDKRQQTEFIGNKRNGFGMVLGHVGTHDGVKVDEVLTQYFIEALKEAGYNAVLDTSAGGASAQNCSAVIQGEIVEFWMDLYMMVWHRVGVNVKAVNPADQKVLWEKLIKGAENRVLWIGATGEFERIVREAITKALNQAAQDFASDDFFNRAIKKQ